jgi:hypothetical protein
MATFIFLGVPNLSKFRHSFVEVLSKFVEALSDRTDVDDGRPPRNVRM